MSYSASDFRMICAWCDTEIRGPEKETQDEVPESHGVCRCCAVKMGMPEDRLVY